MNRAIVHAAALIALVACGGDDPPVLPDAAAPADASGVDAAPPREAIIETRRLQPNESIEGIMTGGAGDFALLHFEAPAGSLSWNLHTHLGGGTQQVVEELRKTVVDYRFDPPRDADWYLLLRNDALVDIDVRVNVGLYGDLTWRWQ